MPKRTSSTPPLLLRVTLEEIEPPVWRRFAMARERTLGQLHEVLQAVMGWQNCHLHEFRVGEHRYGEPDPDAPPDVEDEELLTLEDLWEGAPFEFRYWYDFGDDWWHRVEIEGECDARAFKQMPVCIAGERACPPEDCGGPWGYVEFLDALTDPEHAQHNEVREWIGGEFDAEAFDVAEANEDLRILG